MMCSENPVQLPPFFDGCFSFAPNDLNEVLSYFDSAEPESGSNESNREPSEDNTNNNNNDTTSNSDHHIISERKLRRMLSNRLSARRSRLRKKRHLENLTAQADRLKVQNRDMKTRLELVRCQSFFVRRQNERLKCEAMLLKQRLRDLQQTLLAIQLQNNQQLFFKNTTL